jgi:DNA-binding NarL/FixJ family response regulator
MTKLRVMLADDQALVREGLKALVSGQPAMEVVGEAADVCSACPLAESLFPDVAVLGIAMAEACGAEAAGRLRRLCSTVKVLALSALAKATCACFWKAAPGATCSSARRPRS